MKWRDNTKPSTILEEICSKNHLSPPFFIDSCTLVVNGVEYKDNIRGQTIYSSHYFDVMNYKNVFYFLSVLLYIVTLIALEVSWHFTSFTEKLFVV